VRPRVQEAFGFAEVQVLDLDPRPRTAASAGSAVCAFFMIDIQPSS